MLAAATSALFDDLCPLRSPALLRRMIVNPPRPRIMNREMSTYHLKATRKLEVLRARSARRRWDSRSRKGIGFILLLADVTR